MLMLGGDSMPYEMHERADDIPAHEKLEKILSHAGEVIVITDPGGSIQFRSANIEQTFGWNSAEIAGKRIFEFFHPDETGNVSDFLTRIAGSPKNSGNLELRFRSVDGTYKWTHLHAVNMLDEPAIQGILGYFTDITDRKLAEKKKTESTDLLTNLARLVPGVIYQYRLDPDGQSAFPYSSPGMNDIYEVTPEAVRDDASPVFSRLHPEDTEHVSAKIIESARTLETFTVEFRVILPRQGLRWRWSQAFPERTADGGTLWHGIITDITERKEAEAKQRQLHEQLTQSQKMETVGRLAGGIAHDFNNLLGVIIGYAEMVREEVAPDSKHSIGLSKILDAAERSADLTRQLLAFSRQQNISPQTLHLNDAIAGMMEMLSRLIGENITLHWQPVSDLWPVLLDPTQFHQVLVNLCVNARDAITDAGDIFIHAANEVIEDASSLHIKASSGEYIRLSVQDTGCGMSEAVQKHLFEPFYTTKPIGKGTGLGLSTIYGIIRQNNGFISVESEEGRGTTFHIHLKRHFPRASEPAHPQIQETVYVDDATILLVEDEPELLKISTSILTNGGYSVLPANSPKKALALCESFNDDIHLLLTDVIMPGMNGRELMNAVKACRPRIRCLFMSGYTADVIGPHGILEKGVMFLPKPFGRQKLLASVREAIGVRLKVW